MHRFLVVLAILIGIGFVGTTSVAADPVSFSNVAGLQNDGATRVALLSNPGVTLVGPQITFLADINGTLTPGVPTSLRITYLESGRAPEIQNLQIPAFGTIPPPFIQLFTFTSPGATFQGVNAQLTLEILEASTPTLSNTYTFRVVQPVPEPAAVALFITGLIGVAGNLKRRFGGRPD